MNRFAAIASITFSALSFVASIGTLIVMYQAKVMATNEIEQAKAQIEDVRDQANKKFDRVRAAILETEV